MAYHIDGHIYDSYFVNDKQDLDITVFDSNEESVTNSNHISYRQMESALLEVYDAMWSCYKNEYIDLENYEINRNTIKFPYLNHWGALDFSASFQPENFTREKEDNKEAFKAAMNEKYNFSGSGTKEDPFLISCYDDLCKLHDCVNYNVTYETLYFRQTNDIIFLDNVNWIPIGDLESNFSFSGVYDGNGKVIKNILRE